MEQLFEIHVTMTGDEEKNKFLVESAISGTWKFSKIDGDPVLGTGVKHYATMHLYGSESEGPLEAKAMASWMRNRLTANGVKVLRDKVEMIIHDYKTP